MRLKEEEELNKDFWFLFPVTVTWSIHYNSHLSAKRVADGLKKQIRAKQDRSDLSLSAVVKKKKKIQQ